MGHGAETSCPILPGPMPRSQWEWFASASRPLRPLYLRKRGVHVEVWAEWAGQRKPAAAVYYRGKKSTQHGGVCGTLSSTHATNITFEPASPMPGRPLSSSSWPLNLRPEKIELTRPATAYTQGAHRKDEIFNHIDGEEAGRIWVKTDIQVSRNDRAWPLKD